VAAAVPFEVGWQDTGVAMPWPFAIIVMGLMLAGMYFYFRLVVRLFARVKTTLQERGHKSPALHSTLLAVAFVLPFLITLVTLGYGHEDGLFVIAALFVALPVVLMLVARRLPRRNARTAGPRRVRFPYRLAGYVLCAAGLALWLTGAVTNTNGWFQLGTVTIGAGLGCLAIARRASLPDATTVMARDQRAPVKEGRHGYLEVSPGSSVS
jgi:hypothetical protein